MDVLTIEKLNLLENRPNISSLESLLHLVIKPSSDQLCHITSLTNLLTSNDVSKVFTEAAEAPFSDNSRMTALVINLVKVPDRTISMLGLDQSLLPPHLFPKQYCSLLIRNMATSLRTLTNSSSFNPNMFCATIRQLFLIYSEQIREIQQWWQFLAKWTLQSDTSSILCQKMIAQLEVVEMEKSLLAVLKHVGHPLALGRIFGSSLTQGGRYSALLHILFVRGLSDDTPASVACMVGYIARVDRDKLDQLLIKAVRVWNDEVEVDQGEYTHQLGMAWMICASVGQMVEEQIEKVKEMVIKVMMMGMVYWLEAARHKRVLGMSVALVVLGRVGGSVPDWNVENKELLEQLSKLSTSMQVMEKEKYEIDLVELWEVGGEVEIGNDKKKVVVKTIIKEPDTKQKSVKDDLDSDDDDDDDDDDLPAYDMSDDTPASKDQAPIHYLREVLDHLSYPESDRHEDCLALIPKLSSTHLQHEDPSLVNELLQLVLCIHDQQASPVWVTLRQEAITSVVRARPVPAAKCLVRAVYDRENTLDTKFAILDCLQAGGSLLREDGSAELGEFLTMVVGGLCLGGGGAWGKLKVSGLETSILTHTVLGVASMVRMGEHTTGWEGQVTDYLEFLLSVAGAGKRPAQAAVLHGLGVVAALIPPHMLARERVGELLGEGAVWAGQLVGEMKEAGQNMKNMLSYKYQEGARLQMERDLAQPREIKMRLEKKNIHIT